MHLEDLTKRGMGLALVGIRRLAGIKTLDRAGLREPLEGLVYRISRGGTPAVITASRSFGAAAQMLPRAARQSATSPRRLFDLTPTEEQEMLVAAVRAVAEDLVRPAGRKADDAAAPSLEVREQVRELGLTVLGVPESLGGIVEERSCVTAVLAAEALAHGDLSIAAASLAPGAVATALALHGDAGQQGRYLPSLTSVAPPVSALAVQEPHALFDPFALRTTARREGGDLILDGQKSLVALAGEAELFCVAAMLDGAPGLIIVESSTPGLGIEPTPAMGLRAAATATLTLDGVRVPAEALLGDGARDAYADVVHRARLAWCALAVGTGQAVLDHVIPYVRGREAFGEPIARRQGVAFRVADIAIELEGMRLATYRAAALADRGAPFGRAVAVARRLCAVHGMAIGSDGVQLLGGHGYVKEHPVERWYRDLRVAGMLEGVLLV